VALPLVAVVVLRLSWAVPRPLAPLVPRSLWAVLASVVVTPLSREVMAQALLEELFSFLLEFLSLPLVVTLVS
jgi:hypothetical protein